MTYVSQSWVTGDQVTAVELTDLSGAVVSASSGIADMAIDQSTSHLQVTLADGDLVDAGAVPAASDATVAPILQDTASASYAAAQAAAHAALDTTIAGKVAKGAIVILATDHGVKADGATDDTAALTSAIAAAGVGGTVQLPVGNTLITSPLAITNDGVTIQGSGYYQSRIYCSGCHGITIAGGVDGVRLENLEIAQKVRHTTTANTLCGVQVNGTSSSYVTNAVMRDVYIDGFQTGIQSTNLWSSLLQNVRTNYGMYGIDAYGLSENNQVMSCQLAVGPGTSAGTSGSRGIRLNGHMSPTDPTAVGSEGWVIGGGTVVYAADWAVETLGYANYQVSDCILDFCHIGGVRIADNGTNFGGNALISGNYIAITGTGGNSGIWCANTVANATDTANRISGNNLVVYPSSTCTYGVLVGGANATSVIWGNVIGNAATGFSSGDVYLSAGGNQVFGNRCLSNTAHNISGVNSINEIFGNVGSVLLPGAGAGAPFAYAVIGGNKIGSYIQAPTAGTWALGDRIVNAQPAVGSPKGWTCTVAGTPGTWVSDGNL